MAEELKKTTKEKTPVKKSSKVSASKAPTKKVTKTTEVKKADKLEKVSKPKSESTKVSKVSVKSVKTESIKSEPVKTKKSKIKVLSSKTNEAKNILFKNTVSLPKGIFGLSEEKINTQAIFDSILFERASQRQGTHSTKTRSEVSGGGKKPWKQKGTGRARAGSTRSPIWVGGGITFGPKPQKKYDFKINKKVRNLAFLSSLTLLANKNAILVEDLKLEKISSQELIKKLEDLKINNLKKILIVSDDEKIFKSGRNVQNLHVVKLNSLTVELLNETHALLLSKKDLTTLESRVK
ncbi:50S ribosomal protein L4 [[Mycoplasma] mobile]|uniref:Large ribosomal subunit protein uL4 n=1 Tax=Mycoplasma mobile (strain ATCC 43663 / 163K / NCTC 11711) TaxID=267748 RepID=RL4_MYCM1|nr:50S ribosomal protein L4 [[Mycoplasma] mobile]Q6KI54.1 RecName: Full=Large ribosomal subunit protein uL4; AltName: Full=50S ribosomal protein L4 [Mycoplasma mobile 163K]AAT27722.1 50S ribosomal protein l4 [Mycoplasma mobile 163K]